MTDYSLSLLKKYQNKGILIDTNILLLLFIGETNRARISQFKRTKKFSEKDYALLIKLLKRYSKIVTTPNILTEVNSLINQIGEPERSQCLKLMSNKVSRFHEIYLESQSIAKNPQFSQFGLTDCGIVEVAKDQYLVLTDDLKLASYLQKMGIDTVNFNNLRPRAIPPWLPLPP